MNRATHLLITIIYIVAAAAAGVGLPFLLNISENSLPLMFGAVMVLVGLVAYEVVTRFLDVRRLAQENDVQRRLNAQVLQGISEIQAILERSGLRAGAASKDPGVAPENMDKVMGEFQLLRRMVDSVMAKIDRPATAETHRAPASKGAQAGRPQPTRAGNGAAKPAPRPVRGGNGAVPSTAAEQPDPAAYRHVAEDSSVDEPFTASSAAPATASARPAFEALHVRNPAVEPIQPEEVIPRSPTEIALLNGVREAVKANRIDLFLQPILALPGKERRFFECYSRLRNVYGEYVLPADYVPIAERAGLIGAIDNALLLRCIQLIHRVRQHNYGFKFFCNISSWTLQDKAFLEGFTDLLLSNRDLASSLVFEFTQPTLDACDDRVLAYLNELAGIGFTYSMDHVSNLKIDAANLAARHVRFIKVGVGELMAAMQKDAPVSLSDLQQQLGVYNIELIAEKIETEEMLEAVQSASVKFGQGFVLGKPALSRDR